MRFTNQTVIGTGSRVLIGKAVGEIRIHRSGRLSGLIRIEGQNVYVVQDPGDRRWSCAGTGPRDHTQAVIAYRPERQDIRWIKRHVRRQTHATVKGFEVSWGTGGSMVVRAARCVDCGATS